ncbi:vegetative cell wall protein gp1-like [Corvus cornix cornix]|uniref:vegetative cell wall protein gp1-like n=1 Tax=Corvus cornix cornix TaxID=932674 RepID=UPI00194E15E5|nr:vegetative cell wall protein gp1-like [Corvus cornix cornix]
MWDSPEPTEQRGPPGLIMRSLQLSQAEPIPPSAAPAQPSPALVGRKPQWPSRPGTLAGMRGLPSGSGKPFPGARPRRPLARVSLSQQLLLLPAAGPKLQVDFLPLAPAQPRARASTLPCSSAGAAFVRPQRSGRSSELPFVSPPAAGRAGGAGPGPGQPRPSRLWDTAAAAPAFQPCTRSHSHSWTPQTTPQLLARNPPTTPCIINDPKNHKILSEPHGPAKITRSLSETTAKGPSKHHKCPQETQKPSPVPQGAPRPPPTPHGTDQDRLGDRNIHSPEQLRHFSSDLGTLEVGETQARDWDRQLEFLENRQAQVDTFCQHNCEIVAPVCLASQPHNTQILPNIPLNSKVTPKFR